MANQLRYSLARPWIPHAYYALGRTRGDDCPVGVGRKGIQRSLRACSFWWVERQQWLRLAGCRRQIPKLDCTVERTGSEPLLLTAANYEDKLKRRLGTTYQYARQRT